MTTRSLLFWVALLGGGELALRGHLWNRALVFHGGTWLAAAALAVAAWRTAGARRALAVGVGVPPIALSLLAALGVPGEPENPLVDFWREHTAEREALYRVAGGDSLGLFGAKVALDAHGFRVQPPPPASAYHIVAIGGSSTFGVPRAEDGPPWPALLEQEIAALGCGTRVSVWNAGRTGRGVAAAVRGFEEEIAPLRPDLLLVYPGPADLFSLARAAPPEIGLVPPQAPRVSSLLSRLETGWRRRAVARRYRAALAADAPELEPDAIPLAVAYRQLLVKARRRGVDVALATASLALSDASPEDDVIRYEALDPRTRHAVLANRLHDRLMREVGASYRAVLVDSGAGLDGAGDAAFLDLFHLTREGRARLAENLLAGLRAKLASKPRPACLP